MIDVGESFERALSHVLNNTLGTTYTKINGFIAEQVLRVKPWILLTDDGLTKVSDDIFGDGELQDFMLELTYTFGSYWGASADKYIQLADVLGTSVGIQVEGVLANEIKTRTVTPERATQRLQANRWLMVLILMHLFVEPAMVDGKKVETTGE
jgi:hypothetical protein